MTFDQSQTVREIALNHPASVRVFEELGIDYCCGGKRPLGEACEKANVPIARAMERLRELDGESASSEKDDWTEATLTDLTAHILDRHHRYVRDEAPGWRRCSKKL